MQTSIGRDYVYIASGRDRGGEGRTKELVNDVAYKLPVDDIVSAIDKNEEGKWIQLQNTPNFRSGLVVDSDHPIVVGGNDKTGKPTSDVSIYDPTTNEWSNVGQCVRRHLRSCAMAVSSSSFVVIGGCADHNVPKNSLLDNFELCKHLASTVVMIFIVFEIQTVADDATSNKACNISVSVYVVML